MNPFLEEAFEHSCWNKAMQEEITTLETNNTWVMTDLPYNAKAIGCRWIYKIKHKADRIID